MTFPLHHPQDYCRDFVRESNYNLYLLHFFVPYDCRGAVLALMTLHVELCLIPQKVNDPMMRLIRLKWWKDEIEKLRAGGVHADSPVLDVLVNLFDTFPPMDDYFERMEQSIRGENADIDEIFYKNMTWVIADEKSRNRFVKKLMHHDQLENKNAFRALRLWLGI